MLEQLQRDLEDRCVAKKFARNGVRKVAYRCIFAIPHHPLLADSSGSGNRWDIVAKQQASVLSWCFTAIMCCFAADALRKPLHCGGLSDLGSQRRVGIEFHDQEFRVCMSSQAFDCYSNFKLLQCMKLPKKG